MLKKIFLLILFPFFITSCASEFFPAKNEVVFLVHDNTKPGNSMNSLAEHLRYKGYDVENISFTPKHNSSETFIVEEIAEKLNRQAIHKTLPKHKKIHFVSYAMGTVITRALLNRFKPVLLGRVIFIAPPIQTYEDSDYIRYGWHYKKYETPSGVQLGIFPHPPKEILGHISYDLGVILGDREISTMNERCSHKKIINLTRLDDIKDYFIVNSPQSSLFKKQDTFAQTAHFLENGQFLK